MSGVKSWQSPRAPSWNINQETTVFHPVIEHTSTILNDMLKVKYQHHPGWININMPGAFNEKHTHPGCELAAIYYLKTHKDCGAISFDNPVRHSCYNYLSALSEQVAHTSGTGFYFQMTPEPGTLVVFPAHLEHRVLVNESDVDRISLSWNITTAHMPVDV